MAYSWYIQILLEKYFLSPLLCLYCAALNILDKSKYFLKSISYPHSCVCIVRHLMFLIYPNTFWKIFLIPTPGEISSERYRYQWGVPKKRNIILLTIWCILRWYIVTFDKTKQLVAYPMPKTNLHHFLFKSVTLTFWVLRPFWALKSDLASVIALQLQHFVCQTFWYIKIRNPSTNKKVIPQNVKWYRFPKGLLC